MENYAPKNGEKLVFSKKSPFALSRKSGVWGALQLQLAIVAIQTTTLKGLFDVSSQYFGET